jgi:V/A-type H+-transporting ATPase subunit E
MTSIIGSGLESYVHSHARRRALGLIGEAKAESRRLIEQATAEGEAMRQEIGRRSAHSIEAHRRKAIAQARLGARRILLQRREGCLENVWREAGSLLRACGQRSPRERLALIERLVSDGVEQLSGGALEISVSEEDRELITDEVLQELARRLRATHGVTSLTMVGAMVPAWGGVIMRRANSQEIVDNSLEGRLALAKRSLRDEASALLSQGPDLAAGARRADGSDTRPIH